MTPGPISVRKRIHSFALRARFPSIFLSLTVAASGCGGDAGGPSGPKVEVAASVAAAATPAATAVAGSAASASPTVVVRSASNAAVPGATVTFTVSGGGTIASSSAITDASGQASAGAWTLGPLVGANTVTATVASLPAVTFTVTTTAGAPAAIIAASDNVVTASVGQLLTPGVRVTDKFGNAAANVAVTFAAQQGSVTGASATTDASGSARVGGWSLATTAGVQKLDVSIGTVTAAISVTATPAPGTQIAKVTGDGQSGVAGGLISTMPAVKVTDFFGNIVSGASVTFTVTQGNSVLLGATPVTDANGVARLGGWTLGTTAGNNRLTATLPSGASVSFDAPGVAGPASSLAITAGNAQSATVGGAVVTKPAVRVRDDFGNGVAGVNVTFAVASGAGAVTGTTVTSASDGLATIGSWTLGNIAGANSITASAPGLTSVTITATGNAGAATQIEKFSGDAQTGPAGLPATVAPTVTVKDQFGNAVSGKSVTFSSTSGGGIVTGGTKTTDATGRASVTQWTLGNAGTNSVTAAVAGLTSVVFNATATGTPPLLLAKMTGESTSCPISAFSCTFTVRVTNTLGAAVAGEVVRWSSGAQTPVNTTTNVQGEATSTNIIAQATAGTFTQTATIVSTGQAVIFTYSTTTGSFNIELRYLGTVTPAQQAVFNAAVAKWQSVITGELADISLAPGDINSGDCGVPHPAITGNIDDLVIYVELKYLDGLGTPATGNLLGQAYPCFIRTTGRLPFVGVMQFDTTDLTGLAADGSLQAVITHEMGHVLGIGSLWSGNGFTLVSGAGSLDPFFSGFNAKDYYGRIGGVVGSGNGVPVENCQLGVPTGCGGGTRDVHWREFTFKNELMTGYISRISNPLSTVTIGALADAGYQVNYAAADAYTLATAQSGNQVSVAEGSMLEPDGFWLNEGPVPRPRTLVGH